MSFRYNDNINACVGLLYHSLPILLLLLIPHLYCPVYNYVLVTLACSDICSVYERYFNMNESRYLENWFKIMDCGRNFELTREGNGS